MSFAGKAVVFWLAYSVLFSIVIGLAVGQAKPNKQTDTYKEMVQ